MVTHAGLLVGAAIASRRFASSFGSAVTATSASYPWRVALPEVDLAVGGGALRGAYLLGAKTEYWRAHRNYAGILHFVYLTCSYPGVFTADHFEDVKALKLSPWFEDYMGEAMKPLGVYLNFFQPTLEAGKSRSFRVMMVNDLYEPARGELRLTLEGEDGREVARAASP